MICSILKVPIDDGANFQIKSISEIMKLWMKQNIREFESV